MSRILPLILILMCSCAPVIVEPTPDYPVDTDHCQRAEDRLIEKKCELARPLDGVTFTQFCKSFQESGKQINPSCIAKILTCEEVDEAARRKEPCLD